MNYKLDNYFLQPGYLYASQEQLIISTVLGSCVSVCLWDKVNKFGGMNHFIYPRRGKEEISTKFGDVACPYLFRMMADCGSRLENLAIHVVGGAQNPKLNSSIGKDNADIVQQYLKKIGLVPASVDVGGQYGRKVAFNTATGEVIVYKCEQLRESDWHR